MAITHVYVAPDERAPAGCEPLPSDGRIHWSRTARPREVAPAQIPLTGLDARGPADRIARAAGPSVAAAGSALVDLRSSLFGPPNLSIALGGTVTWRSLDPERHVVFLANGPRAVDGPLMRRGAVYAQRFTVPGTYNLFCYLHPVTMHQTLTVRPTRPSRRRARRVTAVARGGVEQRRDEPVGRVLARLDVRLEAVLAQRVARDRADRDDPRAVRPARGLDEEAHGRGRRERHVVGAERRGAGVVVERLGDRPVQREDLDLGAALAQRVGQDVARALGAGDERAAHGPLGERLDERLGDRARRDDVRLDAARAQRVGGAGADRRDRRAAQVARVAAQLEQPARAVGARDAEQVEAGEVGERRVERLDADRGRLDDARPERAQPRRERAGLGARAGHRDAAARPAVRPRTMRSRRAARPPRRRR